MKLLLTLLLLFLPYILSASRSENEIKVAVLGKFTHFIKYKKPTGNKNFVITVFKDESLFSLVKEEYINKQIHNKNIVVKYIADPHNIQKPDMIYIGKVSQEEQEEMIQYAQAKSLLSVSSQSGFAQRGGIIQLYFLSQKIRFKINLNAAKKSNLKISASLLSISTIVKGEKQ